MKNKTKIKKKETLPIYNFVFLKYSNCWMMIFVAADTQRGLLDVYINGGRGGISKEQA